MSLAGAQVTCPSCGTEIDWRRAPVEYLCPTCRSQLLLPRRYRRAIFWTTLLGVPLVAFGGGLPLDQGWLLMFVTLSAVYAWFAFVPRRFFPPRAEFREPRLTFHSAPAIDAFHSPRGPDKARATNVAVETFEEAIPDPLRPRRRMFQLTDPPVSLEGIAIVVAGVGLALSQAVVRGEALVAAVYPEFHATRTGPKGFPITVHIGAESLHVTNGSNEGWYCAMALGPLVGQRVYLRSSVPVKAHASLDVPLIDFTNLDVGDDLSYRRRLARDNVQVRCVDESGRRHLLNLR